MKTGLNPFITQYIRNLCLPVSANINPITHISLLISCHSHHLSVLSLRQPRCFLANPPWKTSTARSSFPKPANVPGPNCARCTTWTCPIHQWTVAAASCPGACASFLHCTHLCYSSSSLPLTFGPSCVIKYLNIKKMSAETFFYYSMTCLWLYFFITSCLKLKVSQKNVCQVFVRKKAICGTVSEPLELFLFKTHSFRKGCPMIKPPFCQTTDKMYIRLVIADNICLSIQ